MKQRIHWPLRAFFPRVLGDLSFPRRPSSLLEKQKAVGARSRQTPRRRSPEQTVAGLWGWGRAARGRGRAGWGPAPAHVGGQACARGLRRPGICGRKTRDTPNFKTRQEPVSAALHVTLTLSHGVYSALTTQSPWGRWPVGLPAVLLGPGGCSVSRRPRRCQLLTAPCSACSGLGVPPGAACSRTRLTPEGPSQKALVLSPVPETPVGPRPHL